MINKNKLSKLLALGILLVPAVFSISACSSYNNLYSKNDEENYPNYDSTIIGSVPSYILELNNTNNSFTYLKANEYNLKQNYLEYGENNDLSNYVTSDLGAIKNDIYYFAYLLWVRNNKAFTINKVDVSDFVVSNLSNNFVIFDSSKITFNLSISILAIQDISITINNYVFDLIEDNEYSLSIVVNNQYINATINSLSDEYFLGWKVSNATYKFNNNTYTNEYIPTQNGSSFAYPYKIKQLTDKINYLQFYKQYQNQILNVNQTDLENQISTKFNNQVQTILDYIENGKGILGVLKDNPTVKDLIINCIPYITKILVTSNLIPSYLSPLINAAFEPGNEATPFVEIIQQYKNDLITYLETYFGSLASVLSPYLDLFKTGIITNDSDYNSLLNALNSFGLNQTIIDLIFNDVLGVDNQTPKTLLDIIYDNIDIIISLIDNSSDTDVSDSDQSDESESQDDESNEQTDDEVVETEEDDGQQQETITTTQAIIKLLKLVLSKNDQTNEYNKFFDILSGDEKTVFFSSLTSLLSDLTSELSRILNLITVSNEKFTTENMVAFVTSLYEFLDNMFVRNDDYESFLDDNAYQNLKFYAKFNTSPKLDKTNQTITFEYEISFTLTKKVDASYIISSFKNLLSNQAISDLINEFTGTDLDTVVGSIPLVGDFALERVVAAILSIIPNNLWLGDDVSGDYYLQNKFSLTYSANESSFWVKPTEILSVSSSSNTEYGLGYEFIYNTNFKYDDPSFTNSITSNYNAKTNSISLINLSGSFGSWEVNYDISIDFYFYNFWVSLLKYAVLRDYDYLGIFDSDVINEQVVATSYTYSDSLYITRFEVDNKIADLQLTDLATIYDYENKDYQQQVLSDYISGVAFYNWNDGNGTSTIYGYKPIVDETISNEIIDLLYDYNQININNITTDSNLVFVNSVIPQLNFNLPLKITQKDYDVDVDFNIRILVMELQVYNPLKFYDLTNQNLTNKLSKAVFYINAVDLNAQDEQEDT